MTDNMRTVGDKAYSHDSSCIYSVKNQMRTLLSSSCQLRLEVDLSCQVLHKWEFKVLDLVRADIRDIYMVTN